MFTSDLNDSLNRPLPNDPTLPRPSKTSTRESTSSARGCYKFWNESARVLSQKLSYTTAIGCTGSPSSSSDGSFDRLAQGSWFTARIHHLADPTGVPEGSAIPHSLWPEAMARIQQIAAREESELLKKQKAAEVRKNKPPTEKQLQAKQKRADEMARQRAERAEKDRLDIEAGRKKPPRLRKKNPLIGSTLSEKTNQQVDKKRKWKRFKTEEEAAAHEEKKRHKKESPAERARYVRLYLDARQKKKLRKWFGVFRWTYNQCVNAWTINQDTSLQTLCERFVNNDSPELPPWALKVPYNLRSGAVREFKASIKGDFAGREKRMDDGGNEEETKMFTKRLRKKSRDESIPLLSRYYTKGRPYGTCWKDLRPLSSRISRRKGGQTLKDIPPNILYDSRLIRKHDQFFISVSLPRAHRTGLWRGKKIKRPDGWLDNQEPAVYHDDNPASSSVLLPPPSERIVAIDPGVRTFATLYDPSGQLIEWGRGDIGCIQRICYHMDRLQSRMQQVNSRRRRRMKVAWYRMQWRIKNLVAELHHKLAKFLMESYNIILLPNFETSQMVKRGRRRIRSRTARQMMCWSHYKFKQRLLDKAQERPWVRLIICREDYTSKTCGACGWIHWNLGGSKEFRCPRCQYHVDRDLNGARNILIRWLTCQRDFDEPHIRKEGKEEGKNRRKKKETS